MARELSKVYRVPLYEVDYATTSGERAKLRYVENIIVIRGLIRSCEELITNFKDFTILEDRFYEKCNVGEGYKLSSYGTSFAGVARSAHLVILSRDFNNSNYVSGDEVDNYLANSSQNKWVKLYEEKYSPDKTRKVFKKFR